MSIVNKVDVINPPITTVARGLCTSAPVSVAIAIGINPRDATSAVIKTGRNRVRAPSLMAISKECIFNCSLMVVTITKPLRTAIPESAIKPTAADIENGISRIQRLKIPPVNANGTAVKINKAPCTELIAAKRRTKIIKKQPGTTQ